MSRGERAVEWVLLVALVAALLSVAHALWPLVQMWAQATGSQP